jgi:hypothetical protein
VAFDEGQSLFRRHVSFCSPFDQLRPEERRELAMDFLIASAVTCAW